MNDKVVDLGIPVRVAIDQEIYRKLANGIRHGWFVSVRTPDSELAYALTHEVPVDFLNRDIFESTDVALKEIGCNAVTLTPLVCVN